MMIRWIGQPKIWPTCFFSRANLKTLSVTSLPAPGVFSDPSPALIRADRLNPMQRLQSLQSLKVSEIGSTLASCVRTGAFPNPFAPTPLLLPDWPIGFIIMWHGSLATVPDGWQLCDGTNGTPDLRDRFVRGAAGSFSPGETGGAAAHDHAFTSTPHIHGLFSPVDVQGGPAFSQFTTSVPASGITDDSDSEPPWYALAYIMKVST